MAEGLRPLCGRRRWMGTMKLGLDEAPAEPCLSSASTAFASLTPADDVWTHVTCTEAIDPWQTVAEDALLPGPRMLHKQRRAHSLDQKPQQCRDRVRPSRISVQNEFLPDVERAKGCKRSSVRVSGSPKCGRLKVAPKRRQASQRLSGCVSS